MVVAEDAVLGTIGGGHLELLAITAAVHLLFVFVRPPPGHVGAQEPESAT